MLKRDALIESFANDLLCFGSTLAALVTAADFAAQASEIANALLGDGAADLSVGNLLADADVHQRCRQLNASVS
jgi:hypothetical protein